jgi:hypothetical protein
MVFWTVLPVVLVLCVFMGSALWLATHHPPGSCWSTARLLATAAPLSLKLVFLVYPVVTRYAFAAFSWHQFDQDAWLRADVRVQRGSREHTQARAMAIVAIMVYPVGVWLFFATLLLRARHAIAAGSPSTLSQAIAFLHREYEPRYYAWEVPNR